MLSAQSVLENRQSARVEGERLLVATLLSSNIAHLAQQLAHLRVPPTEQSLLQLEQPAKSLECSVEVAAFAHLHRGARRGRAVSQRPIFLRRRSARSALRAL